MQVTQLVNIHSEARDRITIHFEGEQIKQVHLIEVLLKNSGNVPIRPEDFERPITVQFEAGAMPLTVDMGGKTPSELTPEFQLIENGVQLQPLLLNAGDSLKLKILVRDFTGQIAFDYRIVGISQLVDARAQAERSWNRRLFGAQESFYRVMLVAVTVGTGLAIVTSSVGDLFSDSRTRGPIPTYAPFEYGVTLRKGEVICARSVFLNEPREGQVIVVPKDAGFRERRIIPRSAIQSIRRYC